MAIIGIVLLIVAALLFAFAATVRDPPQEPTHDLDPEVAPEAQDDAQPALLRRRLRSHYSA